MENFYYLNILLVFFLILEKLKKNNFDDDIF